MTDKSNDSFISLEVSIQNDPRKNKSLDLPKSDSDSDSDFEQGIEDSVHFHYPLSNSNFSRES